MLDALGERCLGEKTIDHLLIAFELGFEDLDGNRRRAVVGLTSKDNRKTAFAEHRRESIALIQDGADERLRLGRLIQAGATPRFHLMLQPTLGF